VTKIAVVGGGAWGTALADLLVRKGGLESVTLWAREPEVVEHVNRDHLNPVFLPGAARSRAAGERGRRGDRARRRRRRVGRTVPRGAGRHGSSRGGGGAGSSRG